MNICLIDTPGEGAIKSHIDLIRECTSSSQVILHILDGGHIGSKTEDKLIELTKTNSSTIWFILNKKDILSTKGLKDALDLLNKTYDIKAIPVAVLYAKTAHLLLNNTITVKDVLDNKKIKLNKIIISPAWNNEKLEDNKELLANFLITESGIYNLHLDIEKIISQHKLQIEEFVIEKVKDILLNINQKIIALQTEITTSNEIAQQMNLINTLNKLYQNINFQKHHFHNNLSITVHDKLTSAFQSIFCEYKKLLSTLLTTHYKQLEKDSQDVIKIKFLKISNYWRIQNIWETDCLFAIEQHINEINKLTSNDFTIIDSKTVPWNSDYSFTLQVIEKTIYVVDNILGNKSNRPMFAIFRSQAMADYVKKQKDKCLSVWESNIKIILKKEQNNIENNIKEKTNTLLKPIKKYQASLEKEITKQQEKLTQLQNDKSTRLAFLKEKQNKINKLLFDINNL